MSNVTPSVGRKRGPRKGENPYFMKLDWCGLLAVQPNIRGRQEWSPDQWAERHRQAGDEIRRHITKRAALAGQTVGAFVRDVVLPRLAVDRTYTFEADACRQFFARELSQAGVVVEDVQAGPDPIWEELMRGAGVTGKTIDKWTRDRLDMDSPWGDKPKYEMIEQVRMPDTIPTADRMLADIAASSDPGETAAELEVAIFNRWMRLQGSLLCKALGKREVWYAMVSAEEFAKRYYRDESPARLDDDYDDDGDA